MGSVFGKLRKIRSIWLVFSSIVMSNHTWGWVSTSILLGRSKHHQLPEALTSLGSVLTSTKSILVNHDGSNHCHHSWTWIHDQTISNNYHKSWWWWIVTFITFSHQRYHLCHTIHRHQKPLLWNMLVHQFGCWLCGAREKHLLAARCITYWLLPAFILEVSGITWLTTPLLATDADTARGSLSVLMVGHRT